MQPITREAPALPGRAMLTQDWRELVFIHWRVDPEEVAPLLPPGIEADVYDGSTWVGLIPFVMRRTRVLGGPPVPYFGSFTEVNVRLYGVDADGRRGVVFASLEASRLAAVLVARAMFGLPYFWADAAARLDDDVLSYRSARLSPGSPSPSTRIIARRSDQQVPDHGLGEFLTARWLLFQGRGDGTVAMPNRHPSWDLFAAELLDLDDELVRQAGIRSIGRRAPDSVLYSPGVRTDFGAPERVR